VPFLWQKPSEHHSFGRGSNEFVLFCVRFFLHFLLADTVVDEQTVITLAAVFRSEGHCKFFEAWILLFLTKPISIFLTYYHRI